MNDRAIKLGLVIGVALILLLVFVLNLSGKDDGVSAPRGPGSPRSPRGGGNLGGTSAPSIPKTSNDWNAGRTAKPREGTAVFISPDENSRRVATIDGDNLVTLTGKLRSNSRYTFAEITRGNDPGWVAALRLTII